MRRAYLKYFAGLLVFGSNGVVASFIHLSSYEIVLLRSVLGGCLLLALFFATGHRFTFMHHKRDLLFISLSGVTMAVEWLLLFEAYAQIGVSLGMLINYTGSALVILFSPLFLKERITFPKIIALLAALLGAFFISGQAAAHGVSAWELLCAILSAVTYAIMVLTNINRRAAAPVCRSRCGRIRRLQAGLFHEHRRRRMAPYPVAGICLHRRRLLLLFFLHRCSAGAVRGHLRLSGAVVCGGFVRFDPERNHVAAADHRRGAHRRRRRFRRMLPRPERPVGVPTANSQIYRILKARNDMPFTQCHSLLYQYPEPVPHKRRFYLLRLKALQAKP